MYSTGQCCEHCIISIQLHGDDWGGVRNLDSQQKKSLYSWWTNCSAHRLIRTIMGQCSTIAVTGFLHLLFSILFKRKDRQQPSCRGGNYYLLSFGQNSIIFTGEEPSAVVSTNEKRSMGGMAGASTNHRRPIRGDCSTFDWQKTSTFDENKCNDMRPLKGGTLFGRYNNHNTPLFSISYLASRQKL